MRKSLETRRVFEPSLLIGSRPSSGRWRLANGILFLPRTKWRIDYGKTGTDGIEGEEDVERRSRGYVGGREKKNANSGRENDGKPMFAEKKRCRIGKFSYHVTEAIHQYRSKYKFSCAHSSKPFQPRSLGRYVVRKRPNRFLFSRFATPFTSCCCARRTYDVLRFLDRPFFAIQVDLPYWFSSV